MSIEFSQIRELKRALTIFCYDNKLKLNDESALKAAHQLLQYARHQPATSDQLLRHLRSEAAVSSGGAHSEATRTPSQ